MGRLCQMQERLERLEKLIGPVTERDLRRIDYALSGRFGVFVPALGPCEYSITPDHAHPAYMIIANLHSECRVRLGEKTITCEPGALYFFSPGIRHHELVESDFNRYYACMVSAEFFDQCALHYTGAVPRFTGEHFALPDVLVGYLAEYMSEYERGDATSPRQMELLEERIVHIIARAAFASRLVPDKIAYTGIVDRAIHFMNIRYAAEITIEEIAAFVGASPSHFLRIFKRSTAKTPMEFLKRLRLEKARRMLTRDNSTLTQVAYACGFNSSSYFSTSFAAEFGLSPSEYRRENSPQKRQS